MTVRFSRSIRTFAAVAAIASQLGIGVGAADWGAVAATSAAAESSLPDWMMMGGPTPPAVVQTTPPPPPPTVTVNRTTPVVAPPPLMPSFSATPPDAEITRARVFEEPLLPLGQTTATENRALAAALLVYLKSGGSDRVAPLNMFLMKFPQSAWRSSLLTNLGLVYRRTAHFSRALDVWQQAWNQARTGTDRASRAVADRAVAELFELNSRLGRFDELERLFTEVDGRDVRGSASEKVSSARQALWLMRNKPGESFRCGPLALNEMLKVGKTDHQTPEPIRLCQSTDKGTSMAGMRELARQVGAQMQVAHRAPGSAVIVPAMVHWKVGHFAAVVEQKGDRVLMRDPTFGDELWLSVSTLDDEASGYFLIKNAALPEGWRQTTDGEAAGVWGKGMVAGIASDDHDNDPECPNCPPPGGPPGSPPGMGMAVVSIHMLQISATVRDTPIWYTPPKGPSVEFTAAYRQREAFQPQTFSYSNLGPKWSFNWLSYLEDDPGNLSAAVTAYQRTGGKETSTGYDSGTGSYAATVRKQAVITRTSSAPLRYERQMPDGSIEVYGQPDGSSSFPRKVFLTELRDRQGNALTFTWDANLRLVAASDALGQVSTVSYELPGDTLKITKITDPFGRTATFAYDAEGRLQTITDLLGLQSQFTYGASDVMKTVTTPYGTTRITIGEDGIKRWAEITDPMGGRERVQYGAAIVSQEPANLLPTGLGIFNELSHHNTLYWDKLAMAVAPGDPASATDYSWMRASSGSGVSVAVPHTIKKPLENRVWYNYQGGGSIGEGTVRKLSAIGRVLDDGTTQLTQTDYNSRGQITRRVDPLGRESVYEYDTTGLDLLRVKQKNGGSYDLLETRTYNAQHLPLTVTDAAGQATTYTYNAAGQVLTVTNAKSETTTYNYNTNGYLTTLTGPVTGATTTYTYDGYGRVRTVTDSDNYTLTYDYDTAGRQTRVTYPDSTYEHTTYDRLDAVSRRDRLGRVRQTTYDAARRVVATTDPAGRTITQTWCACGSLDALVDANGNRTRWERDLQGRVTREIRADGRDTDYAYETTTGQLKSVTDAKNQVTTYAYFADGRVKDVLYTNEQIPTPDVNFSYDSIYGRVATMVDSSGTTSFSYHAVAVPAALGATRLATIDGPLANDTIAYGYDELGRAITRAINGTANTITWTFDALGRVATEVNALGTFTHTYDGPTNRIAAVTYPNSQTTTYSYFPNATDHRLQTIHHQYPNGSTLSKFDYTYNTVGNILTWRQQADTTATVWEYGYDSADQLVAAVKKDTNAPQAILQRFGYAYDPAGNRTGEQIDDTVTGATYNNVNELLSQHSVGAMMFEGTVNEPATVTVAGTPARVTTSNQFLGTAPVISGTNTITITATDAAGNLATKQYQVSNTANAKTFTSDANGNLSNDGTRSFEWDGQDRMISVTLGAQRTEFTYDGLGRRSRVVEKENGATISDRRIIWCAAQVCEERETSSNVVTQRFFDKGAQVAGLSRFYAQDHLGSIVELTNGSATVEVRYAYDPWGRPTRTVGSSDATDGFTGHRTQRNVGLAMAWYRSYDPSLGRWLNSDPLHRFQALASRDVGDLNSYSYVGNRPAAAPDPTGQAAGSLVIPLCGSNPVAGLIAALIGFVFNACANGGCMQKKDNVIQFPPRRPNRPQELCRFSRMGLVMGEIMCIYDCPSGGFNAFKNDDGPCPSTMYF